VKLLRDIILYDRVLASAGRQSGKTITTAVAANYLAFEYNIPLKILLISAQDNMVYYYVKESFRKYKGYNEQLIGRGRISMVPGRGFETQKGSSMTVKGATERGVAGHPADVVIIDEAPLVHDDVILSAIGCLSGSVAKLALLGTPNHVGLFTKWLTDPKTEYKVSHWSSEKLAWHSKALLKTKRTEYSPARWATDVLGRIPTIQELSESGLIVGRVIIGSWITL